MKFLIKSVKVPLKDDLQKSKAKNLLDLFNYRIKTKIRRDKCCLVQNIKKYENIILMGDDKAEFPEASMQEFCESYFLENMVKKITCLKGRIHCEIFLSDYFMKHSLMYISLHLI